MSPEASSSSPSTRTLMKVFFHRKWFIITPLFAGLVIASVVSFLLPPAYESYTLILVEEQKTISPLIQNLAVSSSVVQRLQTVREQLLGWNNLSQIINKEGLDKGIRDQQQMEELVGRTRLRIKVELTFQELIRISYTDPEPKRALAMVKHLSDSFIRENMRSITQETDLAIEFLKQQLDVYKRKIKESEIAALEEQLGGLNLEVTNDHPLVKELKQKLFVARGELASGKIKIEPGGENNMQYRSLMRKELDSISSAEESGAQPDANTAIYKMFLMDRLDMSQARDIEVNREIYNMLLQRLETAKITQRLEASKQGTRYTVIDPPRLPIKPSEPNKLMVLAMGLFLGGGAGVGLTLGRQFMDQSFLDIDDARLNLDHPVLGAISRITTRSELEREKDKRIMLIIISLILSAALVIGTGLFSLFNQ